MNELAGGPTREDAIAPALLALLAALARELHPSLGERDFTLDDSLEADFALDSLARVEMLARIERTLGVRLAESAAFDAATPRDLLPPLLQAGRLPPAAALRPAAAPVRRAGVLRAPPDSLTSLVAVFAWHVEHHADVPLLTLLPEEGEAATTPLSYGELWRDAQATAAGLRERGIGEGDAVAIMLPTGREFFAAFYGCWLAGAVPVPLYPPARPSQLEDHLARVAGILANAQARVLVTIDRARALAPFLRARAPTLRAVATVAEIAVPGGKPAPVAHAGDTLALLQYTSGSTGDPKGVMLSHANLLASLRAMWRASGAAPDDVFVSWLPLYHDMGLIGACLGSLYVGFPLVLMSPLAFLARPVRWLQAIDRYRATISAGPNFAYELAVNKIDDADLAGLDLGCWRLAFNGAEPVSAATLEHFCERFRRCGFRPSALMPVYGLAEATLGVTFPPTGRGPLMDRVDREALMRRGRAEPAQPDDPHPLCVVSNGLPLPGHDVRIVDAMGAEIGERAQGRVEFRGPAATAGYINNPDASRKLFHGTWLVSGDLGYLAGGELYLTGREKDLIIRRGFNLHPQDLEAALAELPGVRKGGVVVFPASDPAGVTERLVIVAETHARGLDERGRLQAEIGRRASELLGAPADDVLLVAPRTVLKTSSGKLRRAACRELYERGALGRKTRSVQWQMARLAVQTAAARVHQLASRTGVLCWSAWAWLVAVGVGALAWLAALVLPTPLRRRQVVWGLARAGWKLLRVRVTLRGIEALPAGQCVVVANHSSYADAILLAAVLPARFVFTAKEELAHTTAGWPLRRIDTAFVARSGDAHSIEDARALTKRLESGESLIFFPEGTFQRASGLLPFRLGAFASAAAAHIPVVPLALRGTRSLLPSERWQAQRHDLEVIVGSPIEPVGGTWSDVLALRDRARAALLQLTGEPDLGAELGLQQHQAPSARAPERR